MRLSGNTVLITGGASGIGYAMARHSSRPGSEVAICGRRRRGWREARARHPELQTQSLRRVAGRRIALGLRDWASRRASGAERSRQQRGRAARRRLRRGDRDVPGRRQRDPGEPGGADRSQRPVRPLLAGQGDAAIVNVSSGLGFVPAAKMPVYSATKAGLHAFSMALRLPIVEGRDQGLRGRSAGGRHRSQPGRARQAGRLQGQSRRRRNSSPRSMKGLESDVFEIGYRHDRRLHPRLARRTRQGVSADEQPDVTRRSYALTSWRWNETSASVNNRTIPASRPVSRGQISSTP